MECSTSYTSKGPHFYVIIKLFLELDMRIGCEKIYREGDQIVTASIDLAIPQTAERLI